MRCCIVASNVLKSVLAGEYDAVEIDKLLRCLRETLLCLLAFPGSSTCRPRSLPLRTSLHHPHTSFPRAGFAAAAKHAGDTTHRTQPAAAKAIRAVFAVYKRIRTCAPEHGIASVTKHKGKHQQELTKAATLLIRYLGVDCDGTAAMDWRKADEKDAMRLLSIRCECGDPRCNPAKYGYQLANEKNLFGASGATCATPLVRVPLPLFCLTYCLEQVHSVSDCYRRYPSTPRLRPTSSRAAVFHFRGQDAWACRTTSLVL